MKKIIMLLLLFIGLISSGQVTIEIITPDGEYKSYINQGARVHIEVTNDSLLIHSNNITAVYLIKKIVVSKPSTRNLFLGRCEIFISKDTHNLKIVTMWSGVNLVLFEYKDGTQVLNSGKGVTYYNKYLK